MSNSPLVNYICYSPHYNKGRIDSKGRKCKIAVITPHCVVGRASVESLGRTFSGKREVSANYGIGNDGRIGLYVDEANESFCSSNRPNDKIAVTIECASDNYEPYAINDTVYNALVDLCVDICERNGIDKLIWKADPKLIGHPDKQNITVHRWFANKSCPGKYIYDRLGQIAAEVNAKLNPEPVKPLYRVQVGAFKSKVYATNFLKSVKAKGFKDAYIASSNGYYKIQVGAFHVKLYANSMLKKLENAGFDGFITTRGNDISKPTPPKKKSVETVAGEIIAGTGGWGNNPERRKKLIAAGYDPDAVQAKVNELLGIRK